MMTYTTQTQQGYETCDERGMRDETILMMNKTATATPMMREEQHCRK